MDHGGNMIYKNGFLKRILLDGDYIKNVISIQSYNK